MRVFPLFSAIAVATATTTSAAFIAIVQPSADLNDVVWTVEWDNLTGAGVGTANWGELDPATGGTLAASIWPSASELIYANIGDPFGAVYDNGGSAFGFGDGVGGVISSPSGFGVAPDHDAGANLDDVYVFSTSGSALPAAGSFTITVPGANIGNYNLGVFDTSNGQVSFTVTNVPLGAAGAVPEPGTYALLGLLLVGGLGYARRRRS